MKLKIKILVGISGSGKSTFSKNYILENQNYKRINRDDLRSMFDNSKKTKGNDNFVKNVRDELIKFCLEEDRNIIIDDTNCEYEQLLKLTELIRFFSDLTRKDIEIEVIDFDIDIKTCLERNSSRSNPLDDRVLYFMKKNKDLINFKKLPIDSYIKINQLEDI